MDKIRQSLNKIVVEGLMIENTLESKVSEAGENYVTGEITLRVDENDVPIKLYSKEFKKDGAKSKVYPNLMKLINIPSLASDGVGANIIVSGGEIAENVFFTDQLEEIAYSELKSNFYKKSGKNFKPQCKFEFEGVVRNIYPEILEDIETGRLIVEIVGVNFHQSAVPVKFVVEKEKAIAYIKAYYSQGKTVRVNGDIRYIPEEITKVVESAFGDDVVKTYDKVTKSFIITSGTEPYTDNAYSQEDIVKAMQNRQLFVDSKKADKQKRMNESGGANNASTQSQPNTPNTPVTGGKQSGPNGFPF